MPNKCDRICDQHFRPEDITVRRAANTGRMFRVLDPNALPLKPQEIAAPLPEDVSSRRERAKRRLTEKEELPKIKVTGFFLDCLMCALRNVALTCVG